MVTRNDTQIMTMTQHRIRVNSEMASNTNDTDAKKDIHAHSQHKGRPEDIDQVN